MYRDNRLDRLNKPYRIYAEYVEHDALEQFVRAMEQDEIAQGALMPDTHTGYSLPIGAVVAAEQTVYPAFVGYDIGCGMSALPIPVSPEALRACAKAIFDSLYKAIPVGFAVNTRPSEDATALDPADLTEPARFVAEGNGKASRHWSYALGSLGGGNHFIELGVDEADQVWAVIHSGSRGVGHGIAAHYMKLASGGQKAREGCFGLRTDSDAGQGYINDMNWALQFALDNRLEMMRRIVRTVNEITGEGGDADFDRLINRNHNHATTSGDGYWIHRKGATHAEDGMLGVIPGNMRDGSFVVRGKGNPESLFSSSHGAGRVLGRRQAKETLEMGEFVKAMDGIVARVEEKTLDESPFCYKDVFEVMRLQRDLVDVLHHIKPVINIKG